MSVIKTIIENDYDNPTVKLKMKCDGCGTEYLNGMLFDTFEVLVDLARSDGWQARREHGKWHNYCPICKEMTEWR